MKVEQLLVPISADAPAGVDCHDNPKFGELQELAAFLSVRAGLPELRRDAKIRRSGDHAEAEQAYAQRALDAAEELARSSAQRVKELTGRNAEPDAVAREVEERASELLRKIGKDLEVVQFLTLAAVHLRGLQGLLEGLAVFDGLMSAMPESVHPQPDPSDPTDVMMRTNILGEMAGGPAFIALLRESVLLDSSQGSLQFRDAAVLQGKLPASPIDGLSGMEHLVAVFFAHAAPAAGLPDVVRSTDDRLARIPAARDVIQGLYLQIQAALDTFRRVIDRFPRGLVRTTGTLNTLELAAALLGKVSDDLLAELNRTQLQRTGMVAPTDGVPGVPATVSPGATIAPAAGHSGAVIQKLATRDDARRQIILIAEFLDRIEPSHPAPLFLRRAARLLAANSFFDIVEDMLEGSIGDVERLAGQPRPQREETS